jgi:NADH-quinone oxidoreductase subunit C
MLLCLIFSFQKGSVGSLMPSYEDKLRQRLGDGVFTTSEFRDNKRLHIPADKLFDAMKCLKEEGNFDFLADIAGVDYLNYPNATDRYGVIYTLANTQTAEKVIVKVMLNDPDPMVASVFPLWKGADWMEREVYDMFGVVFDGHPDLRRILMPEGFISYPLRKDYPLRGRGERHNFPTVTRAES